MKSKLLLAPLALIFAANVAVANVKPEPQHGFIFAPKSRAVLCWIHENSNCGAVEYDPMSIEGPKGFPQSGPRDGKIASGDNSLFYKLNEQSVDRWKKVPLTAGKNTFHWTLTQPHKTAKWEFFITKQDWNPNAPLTRASFDLKPFCERFDGGAKPDKDQLYFECNVPQRTGYQVILGVWSIADTANAFYQVVDVDMKAK
ncbi:MAG TPA: lytic polysaccharide monooxygenase [Arsenophonus nasoniae]|uniref:Lytic polysaccharide monooxygenase n=1 Tax=Arsenophonus nasoniae TaxID=638 RepID=A0AA95GM78_9GAMM|nr:lytic polysaccharide monooxygenase [Arsenophonus nasoniae]WGL96761.1 lytic polysaccharide monooxygenase [Arsenophonus nasoniae]